MRSLAATIAILFAFAGAPAWAQMITLSPAQIGDIFRIARIGNDMAPVEAD